MGISLIPFWAPYAQRGARRKVLQVATLLVPQGVLGQLRRLKEAAWPLEYVSDQPYSKLTKVLLVPAADCLYVEVPALIVGSAVRR